MRYDEMGGRQFLLTWISGYVDFSGIAFPYVTWKLPAYLLALVSLHRDRLQCLLRDQHQLSVLPAKAVTDPLAKHLCPPGWQLVFSQISPPHKSLPSSTPAKTDAHRVYVAWISDYVKLRGPGINQTGCRRKHSLFCAARIFQQWLIFGMCLIWVRRAYSLSWDFRVFFLGSLSES
jgi:hypothetical protein